MIVIDGSEGEGGGQILRSALALSLVTGTPFRIEKIRGGRKKPGLLRQHLTAVKAAAQIGGGDVEGDELGSQEVTFRPATIRPGSYTFSVGTAGSAGLVLQTVLPPLLLAAAPSRLTLEGGTHNPWAPPFDFLARTFLPLLRRMGVAVEAELERPGFYPAGGGRFHVSINPPANLSPLHLLTRGDVRRRSARALVANLPTHIGEREVDVVRQRLGWIEEELSVGRIHEAAGPGNVLILEIESEHITEVFTGFGEQNVRSEVVAERTIDDVRRYLSANVPVGRYLADQLLIPLALAGGGSFRTLALTRHASTNIDILQRFLDVRVHQERSAKDDVVVEMGRP